jgi:hypothetical protein
LIRKENDMAATEQPPSDALERIRDALAGLRYGEVTVVVQDGVIVQVERTEKVRLQQKRSC